MRISRNLSALAALAALSGCGLVPELPGGSQSQTVRTTCIGCEGGITITVTRDAPAPAPASTPEAPAMQPAEAPSAATESTIPEAQDAITARVRAAEGFSPTPYEDAGGKPHIGYGHQLPLTEAEANALLAADLAEARASAERVVGAETWATLDPARQDALTEAAFVLGATGLSRFEGMLSAIRSGDFETAAAELLDSRWAEQAPDRVQRLAEEIGG